jgi:hypothetical protein
MARFSFLFFIVFLCSYNPFVAQVQLLSKNDSTTINCNDNSQMSFTSLSNKPGVRRSSFEFYRRDNALFSYEERRRIQNLSILKWGANLWKHDIVNDKWTLVNGNYKSTLYGAQYSPQQFFLRGNSDQIWQFTPSAK